MHTVLSKHLHGRIQGAVLLLFFDHLLDNGHVRLGSLGRRLSSPVLGGLPGCPLSCFTGHMAGAGSLVLRCCLLTPDLCCLLLGSVKVACCVLQLAAQLPACKVQTSPSTDWHTILS